MATRSSKTSSGAPRWTYVVAALSAAAALIWAIVTHFFPKPVDLAPPTPSMPATEQVADAQNGTAINASGNSRVIVGEVPAMAPQADAVEVKSPTAESKAAGQKAGQTATAGAGGIAINAADQAEIKADAPK